MGMFLIGFFTGWFLLMVVCLLSHRPKPDRKSFDVVVGNVQGDHKVVVTFRKKGGSNGAA